MRKPTTKITGKKPPEHPQKQQLGPAHGRESRAVESPLGTVGSVKIRTTTLVLSLAVLAACSSKDASAPTSMAPETTAATTMAPSTTTALTFQAVTDAIIDAPEFYCETGGLLWARQKDGASLYTSEVVENTGAGLQIYTTPGFVSYARFTAPVPADASSARRAMLEKAGSSWVTANIPDTILLEEMPATAPGCLSYLSAATEASVSDVKKTASGVITFDVKLDDGSTSKGQLNFNTDGSAKNLSLISEKATLDLFVVFGKLPAGVMPELIKDGEASRPSPVITVSMEEYQTLVGG